MSHRLFLIMCGGLILVGSAPLRAQFTHTWTGGDIVSSIGVTTIGSSESLAITAATEHDFNTRALINDGLVEWQAGRLRSGGGGSIANQAQWNDLGTSTLGGTSAGASAYKNDFGGSYTFTNTATGTYTKSGSGITTFQDVPFINAGAVVVEAGLLVLNGGGSSTGTFTAASGATIRLTNNYAIANGSNLLGDGVFESTGGTTTIDGTVNVTNYQLAGTATLAGTHTFTGGVTWTTGTLNSAGTTTNAFGSTFTIAGTNEHDFNARNLVNQGTINWQAGRLRSGGGGSIANQAQWNDLGTSTLGGTSAGASAYKNDFGGSYTFTNTATGTYTKSGSGITTFHDVPFSNAGAVVVQAGTLRLNGGGTSSGSFHVAAGAVLDFTGNHTINDGSALSGTGAYSLSSGTLTINGDVNLASLPLHGGTLAGTHSFAGDVIWNGTSLNAAGSTTIKAGASLTIAGTNDHDFNARALINDGLVEWQAGRLRSGGGGSVINQAQWNDLGTSTLGGATVGANAFKNDYGGSYTFANAATGTYTKTGTGTTIFQDVPFTNAGLLEIEGGILSAVSSFTLQAGGQLAFGLGGTTAVTDFGLLSKSGALVLAGQLQVYFRDGFESFVTAADTFTLVNAGSLTGDFSNVFNGGRIWTTDGFGSFQAHYGAGSSYNSFQLVLSDFAPIPEPSTSLLLILGGPCLFIMTRRRR